MAEPVEKSLQKSTAKVAASAAALEQSSDLQLHSAIRRTELAADRTVLAAERTYAAWVRTGLTAMAFGVGAKALLEELVPSWLASLTASFMIACSTGCFIAAVWREFWPGVPPPVPDTTRIPVALLLIVNGFLVLVSLATLFGMWVVDL